MDWRTDSNTFWCVPAPLTKNSAHWGRSVHYRVYDEYGEVTLKTSFDKDDTSLGRIDVLSVSPPHTVASLKICIAKAEGMADHDLQVLEDDMGEIIMKDDHTITILADIYWARHCARRAHNNCIRLQEGDETGLDFCQAN